jgi:hypothetical protein
MNENISGSFSDCEYPGLYTYEPSPFVRFHDNRNHVHEISVPREIQATKRVSLKNSSRRPSRFQVVMGTDGRLHRVMRRQWLKQGRRLLFVSSTYDEKEDDISILQSDAFDNDEEEMQDTHILYSGGQQESIIDDARSTISRISCFENNIFDRVICQ